MAERLNKVYAEGLTRFETRGRSTSAIQSTNVDQLLGKYTGRKEGVVGSKRPNYDVDIDRMGGDRYGRIPRAEKEAMSRSIDKFLHKPTTAFD